jgi:hypothetical protein
MENFGKPQKTRRVGLKNIHLFGQAIETNSLWKTQNIEGLSRGITIKKYTTLGTIEDWIRMKPKNHIGGLVI